MITDTSSPSDRPVTTVVGLVERAPLTRIMPPGSDVEAVTASVPSVADVVVAAYLLIDGSNAGYIPTPVPATASVRDGGALGAAWPATSDPEPARARVTKNSSRRRMSLPRERPTPSGESRAQRTARVSREGATLRPGLRPRGRPG